MLAVIVGTVTLIIWANSVSTSSPAASAQPTAPSHYPTDTTVRMLAFGPMNELSVGSPVKVSFLSGTLPKGTKQVTVVTDENCNPDAQGIYHCLNKLSYGTGTIMVQNTHRMMDQPCLQPGEVLHIANS